MNRISFLGVQVDALTKADLLRSFQSAIHRNDQIIVGNHNLHSIYLYHRNPAMRDFYELAENIYIDGMPLVIWGAILGLSLERQNRITLSEWLPTLFGHAAQRGWRIFYLGSRPLTVQRGIEFFRKRYPDLQVDARHGFFNMQAGSSDNDLAIAEIQTFRPHLLMVGMGMPRQETWILENYRRLDANVVIAVGAAMDYFAGAAPLPPPWLGRLGLEWLFRLASEPSRLWKRYLVEPLYLLKLLPRDFIEYRISRRDSQ